MMIGCLTLTNSVYSTPPRAAVQWRSAHFFENRRKLFLGYRPTFLHGGQDHHRTHSCVLFPHYQRDNDTLSLQSYKSKNLCKAWHLMVKNMYWTTPFSIIYSLSFYKKPNLYWSSVHFSTRARVQVHLASQTHEDQTLQGCWTYWELGQLLFGFDNTHTSSRYHQLTAIWKQWSLFSTHLLML